MICTSRKTTSEQSDQEPGFGLFCGSRNAGVGRTECGGRQEVASHGSMYVEPVDPENVGCTDTNR